MLRVRAGLEADLLQVPYIDFVSVAFAQDDTRVMMITLGTSRPDLVTAQVPTAVLPAVARHLHEHLAEGRWQPEFQILKGAVYSQQPLRV